MKPAPLTPREKQRIAYDKLAASLVVPQHTSIASAQPAKAKPTSGMFRSA